MARDTLSDLAAFLEVARARSFTRAAAVLGVSQSAPSQTIAGLEARLGLWLLTRTTRSVSPTEAGERLLAGIGPHLDGIARQLAAIGALREKPAGVIRITCSEQAATMRLWPVLEGFLALYPDIKVELSIEAGLTRGAALRCRGAVGRAGGKGHGGGTDRAGFAHGGRGLARLSGRVGGAADTA